MHRFSFFCSQTTLSFNSTILQGSRYHHYQPSFADSCLPTHSVYPSCYSWSPKHTMHFYTYVLLPIVFPLCRTLLQSMIYSLRLIYLIASVIHCLLLPGIINHLLFLRIFLFNLNKTGLCHSQPQLQITSTETPD